MSLVIDAHQHFWQLNLPFDYDWLRADRHAAICRDYLPEDLAPRLAEARVDRTVFVQTQHNLDENRWALELAERNPWIAGVVGWVDLASPACEDQLLEFRQHGKFVGVRHITQDEPDVDFIVRPAVIRGLKALERHRVPFDLLFYVQHLPHAVTLARTLPDLPLVIDHLAKPRIKDRVIEGWERDLRAAAEFPNIYCKLSGMVTEADWNGWQPDDLRPYVEIALEAFGPGRCMFGSDWPVCELAGSYGQVRAALDECLVGLSDGERRRIYGGTAAEFYQLELQESET